MSKYFHYHSPNSTSPFPRTGSEGASTPPDPMAYAHAIGGFVFGLLIYCCLVCHIWGRSGEASKKEVDKSIVRKRVLPHGQSHLFRSQSGQSDCVSDDEETCPGCCFNRRQKRATDPAPAESNPYYHSHHSCAHCSSSIRSADNASNEAENAQKRNCGCSTDALVLSEEGSNASSEYAAIICPICLEQLLVGEPVAWSKIGYCRHFFHYDCILRWAVLGNVTCPVCREEFWSRNALQTCIFCHHDAIGKDNYQSFGLGGRPSAQAMRQSTFCVRHGLVSPSRRMVNEGGS